MWQPGRKLEDYEKEIILKELAFRGGNKTHTANALGIALRTLQNKLHQYGVKDADGEPTQPVAVERRTFDPSGLAGHAETRRLQATAETAQRASEQQAALRTEAGVRVEQNAQADRAEQPMPVQQRQEVQAVSPATPASGSAQKR